MIKPENLKSLKFTETLTNIYERKVRDRLTVRVDFDGEKPEVAILSPRSYVSARGCTTRKDVADLVRLLGE